MRRSNVADYSVTLENGMVLLREKGRGTFFNKVMILAYLLSGAYRAPRDSIKPISDLPGFFFSFSFDKKEGKAVAVLVFSPTACQATLGCSILQKGTFNFISEILFEYEGECNIPTEASKTDISNLRSAYGYMVKAICEKICRNEESTYNEMKKLVEEKLSFRELPYPFKISFP